MSFMRADAGSHRAWRRHHQTCDKMPDDLTPAALNEFRRPSL